LANGYNLVNVKDRTVCYSDASSFTALSQIQKMTLVDNMFCV